MRIRPDSLIHCTESLTIGGIAVSIVEREYLRRMQALTMAERVERSMAMLAWTREAIARQILAEFGPLPVEELKWRVALRQYGSDPSTRALIAKVFSGVSA